MKTLKHITFILLSIFSILFQSQNNSSIKIKEDTAKNTKAIESQLNFICFGLISNIKPEFTEKYGVGIKTETCVITPYVASMAKKNNVAVEAYLDQNFGKAWQKELGFTPFGLNW